MLASTTTTGTHGVRAPSGDSARATILVVLAHSSLTLNAIERAVRLSTAVDGDLHVVVAVPAGASRDHPALLVREAEHLIARLARGRRFSLELRHGDLVEHGAAVARTRDVVLVIVDATFAATEACRLVDALQVPVLVARAARPAGTVIAARARTAAELPILSLACGLARPLRRPVMVVEDGGEPVTTVVAAAAARDADIVVIGHRTPSWIARLFGRDEAARVVEHCSRTVAIVPLAS